jgi:hypothetical protein
MKKVNFKYLTLLAAALLLGFSSCGNDDETGGGANDDTKSVFLKISGDTPATYSEGAPQTATSVIFSTGHLYFTDNSGVILEHYTLSSEETQDHNINISGLTTSGTRIENIPMSVTGVHIVGNVPSSVNIPTTGNISAVKAQALGVETQKNISNVGLYGSGTISDPSEPGEAYTSSVKLNPIVARIELPEIKVKGSEITAFKVDGIFVDNFYQSGQAAGEISPESLVTSNNDPAKYNDNVSPYLSAYKGTVYDSYTSGFAASDTPLAVKPESSNVWGYNLFASTQGSAVPRIIIRLSGITGSGEYEDTMFLTVTGFSSGGGDLFGIQAGRVYKITSIEFEPEDISETPAKNTIDVEVTVTLATWTVVDVKPTI